MKRFSPFLVIFGGLAIFVSFLIFILTFWPVFKAEIGFMFNRFPGATVEAKNDQDAGRRGIIFPVDEEFGIVIPKIGANSKVMANIDLYNEYEYQQALTKGVAHAKGTSLPGETGNVFIFSHSSTNFYEASRYNSVFYLLSKLEKGDDTYLFYKGQKYKYKVTDKLTVDPSDLSFLTKKTSDKTLTLMTCWPPGTALKRLMVIGKMEQSLTSK